VNIDQYILDALKIHIPNSKGKLGTLIKSNTDKSLQVYALDLGRGMKMITHVSGAPNRWGR
jgi:hypothetical protein